MRLIFCCILPTIKKRLFLRKVANRANTYIRDIRRKTFIIYIVCTGATNKYDATNISCFVLVS